MRGIGFRRCPLNRLRNVQIAMENADVTIVQRLLKQRWGLTDEVRLKLLARLVDIATSEDTKRATAVKAFAVLVSAEALDVKAVQVAINAAAVQSWAQREEETRDQQHRISEVDVIQGIANLLERKVTA